MTSHRRQADELNEVLRDTREALPLLRHLAIQTTAVSLFALVFPSLLLRAIDQNFGTPTSSIEAGSEILVLALALSGVYAGTFAITFWRKWYGWRRHYLTLCALRA
jgi:hypothetical protein